MAEAPLNTGMDHAEASEILRTSLRLKGSPVAAGLRDGAGRDPAGDAGDRFKNQALQDGEPGQERGRDLLCHCGEARVHGRCLRPGPQELTPSLKTGRFYYKLGKFESPTSSKRTMESIPHLPTGETYATMYAPLETAPFTPQVILIVTNPVGHAEARAILAIPARGKGACRLLRHPVGLFGRGRPDLSHRKAELLARVRRLEDVLRDQRERDGDGIPRGDAAGGRGRGPGHHPGSRVVEEIILSVHFFRSRVCRLPAGRSIRCRPAASGRASWRAQSTPLPGCEASGLPGAFL